uniref:Zn(2)-C6 fungal-type domain-containing protein n=1 Tax=Bionectria ochroleuca TaxID=29856 RepID=A0A8H7KDX4_BIOOC
MEPLGQVSGASFTCPICQKAFSIRSSFGRHSRQCLEREISRPRRRSCLQCSKRKLGCDRKHPTCSRCASQGGACEYATSGRTSSTDRTRITPPSSELGREDSVATTLEAGDPVTSHALSQVTKPSPCTGKVNQQLRGTQSQFDFALTHLCRIFRTYPRMLATCDRLPPFIHRSQIMASNLPMPLSNCLALCRMWANNSSVETGGDFLKVSMKTELLRLLNEYREYDGATLVAAFQAAIIYAIALLFPAPHQPPSRMFDLSTLAALKEFGEYIRSGTVMMPEEVSHTRPPWQQWLQVSCKRRSLICLYCFEWMNAMLNNFQSFPCTNAEYMPTPAGKVLWEITAQEKWEVAYDRWLGRWAGLDVFTLGDLENMMPGPTLDLRSEMWLEEADELGILLMTLGL